eukprot:COSAG01_NODE_6223_length_3781_cov_8.767789_6_plen_63_part_00
MHAIVLFEWGLHLQVLHEVLGEMAALFDDPVFHIGADETFVKVSMLAHLQSRFMISVLCLWS